MGKIVQQADVEGVQLSEVERKILYFSETSPTLPDIMEVNEIFDREYNQTEYEKKVVNLIQYIRNSERRDKAAKRAWKKAVQSCFTGDYYMLVMLEQACGRQRPPGDFLKLIGTAVLIVAVIFAAIYLFVSR